jgi:hypothetical protein
VTPRTSSVLVYLYGQDNTLAGSIRVAEQPSTRPSQVWTYYGVRNPLKPLDKPDNYRSALATVDLENETLNGSSAINKIFGTGFPASRAPTRSAQTICSSGASRRRRAR